MLSRLKDWFGRPAGASSAEDDARRRLQAMALLMMEAARADLQAQERETRTIDEILQQHAGLDAAQAAELRQCAAAELDRSVSLHQTIAHLNDRLSQTEKRQLMRWLWQVVCADDVIDPHEEHTLRRLAELLHLSHADFIRTKLEVTGEEPG